MIDDTINTSLETTSTAVEKEIESTEQPAVVAPVKAEPEVVDVDLGFVEKKRFRICGDYNRMLELNVSDLNIFSRLKKGYPQLNTLMDEAKEKIMSIPDDADTGERLSMFADRLTEIDAEMRRIIDFIFDTNASEVCAPSGNMFDPVGGQWRFERIIDKLSDLYGNGLNNEFKQLKNRVESKTSKYTKKRRK